MARAATNYSRANLRDSCLAMVSQMKTRTEEVGDGELEILEVLRTLTKLEQADDANLASMERIVEVNPSDINTRFSLAYKHSQCGNDNADASTLETAKRELMEETGYAVESIAPSGIMYANASSHNNKTHSFVATGARLDGTQKLDEYEQIEVVLMPLPELLDLMNTGTLFPTSHHACVYNGLRTLGRLSIA